MGTCWGGTSWNIVFIEFEECPEADYVWVLGVWWIPFLWDWFIYK
jgi:hypothetical protein